MGNPRTGHYECPRCQGQDVYKSEETTGAMAMTLDTPGPVDPTLVNYTKSTVIRCRNCGEKARWFDSPETIRYKQKRDSSATKVIGIIAGIGFFFGGIYIMAQDIEGTTGLVIGAFVASAFFLLIGIGS